MTENEMWATRAVACELLALSLRYPDETLAGAAASGEWLGAAREVAGALELGLPEGFGVGLPREEDAAAGSVSDEQVAAMLHELRPEATRLFVGAPDPACSPYEGVWRAQADGVQPLLFVNPHSMEVERFCRSCGLGRPEGTNEPLDHAATELELLCHLASRAAGTVDPSACIVSEADLPGGSAAAAYDQFVTEHLNAWAPQFAEKLAAEARHPFYCAVAALLAAFLA